jgi:hypothetical protein
MGHSKSARPSPAMIVAALALVAALAGTAVAGSGNDASTSISGSQTKKIAKQQGKKQAKKQIKKLLPISSEDLGEGSAVAAKLGSISQVTGPATPVPPTGATVTSTATCPVGSKVLGGGSSTNESAFTPHLILTVGNKRSNNGWSASGYDLLAAGTGTMTAYAYCLEA